MPAVTVLAKPNGLPMAMTQSPTRVSSESPNSRKGSGSSDSTRSTARSVFGSRPTTSAFSSLSSWRRTRISSALSITWWLVTMMPEGSTMKPEPSDVARRGGASWRSPGSLSKNFRKNSSNGEPGGNCGRSGERCRSTVCRVEILTTAGSAFSASSAKLSGVPCARSGGAAAVMAANRIRAMARRMAMDRCPPVIGLSAAVQAAFSRAWA